MLPAHLQALADLCRRYPTARKVVFAPSAQGGRAAADALARSGVAALGLEVTTVGAHASEWVPPSALAEGARPLPFFAEPALVAALASEAGGDVPPVGVGALRRQVEALRLAGPLVPADEEDPVDAARTSALRALAGRYGEALGPRLDAAATLRLAADHVRATGPPPATVYAAFDEAEWGPLAARLVDALAPGEALHRVGFALPGLRPPRWTAAHSRWADDACPHPEAAGAGAHLATGTRSAAGPGFRFRRAVGAQAEVRDALRDVLARGLPLDTVEVATTAADPYLALLQTERDLRPEDDPLPVTFAAGVPVLSTRAGQGARGLLDWLEEGREVATLVRLLQGGLLVLGTALGAPGQRRPLAPVSPAETAHLLVEGGLGAGPGAAALAVGRAGRARAERSGDRPVAADGRVGAARSVLGALDDLFPDRPVPPADFAAALRRALLLYGPEGAHGDDFPGRPSGDLSHSELAHRLLAERLARFVADPPTDRPAPPAEHARAFRDAALDAYVDARAPRPGHLHVVPLSSAGLAGRPHLYVLGLDADTAAGGAPESALLPDREAVRLDPQREALPTSEDVADASLWHAARALARVPPPTPEAPTSVTFCQRTLDLRSGDPLAPSGLLLRAAGLAGHDAIAAAGPDGPWPTAPLVPDSAPVHESEADLAGRHLPADRLAARFPAAARGLAAARARASAALTVYDGWLGPDHPGVPLVTDRPISPSRLETMRACPLRHFAASVLGVRPAPEAPDASGGLSAKDRGSLLHAVFEDYGNRLLEEGRPASLDDLAALRSIADRRLEGWTDLHGALDDFSGVRADLHATVRVFLRSEVHHGAGSVPAANEMAFGLGGSPPAVVHLDGLALPLRGVVDRVDRLPDGTFEVGDFKTGSAYGFPDPQDADPLSSGKLQWALYALAVEQATQGAPDGPWTVSRSGYRFVTPRAAGEWRSWTVPSPSAVADALRPLVRLAGAGLFGPRPKGKGCRYCGVARGCGDLGRRKAEVDGCELPDDHPHSDALADLHAL